MSSPFRSESEHNINGTNKMIFYDSLKRRKSIREREGSQLELQRLHSGDIHKSGEKERYEWLFRERATRSASISPPQFGSGSLGKVDTNQTVKLAEK